MRRNSEPCHCLRPKSGTALLCVAFMIFSFFRPPSTAEALRTSLKEPGCPSLQLHPRESKLFHRTARGKAIVVTGRRSTASIDPELMIPMLIEGYVFAIRSERLICREVQVNSHIAGSANSVSRMLCRIIRPSRVPAAECERPARHSEQE